jgi:hypothetical protein
MKLDHLKLSGKFEFSSTCALWTIKLSQKFFRINWSQIRQHFQKRKCSEDGLTFSYLCNAISSQILGVRLWMFPRSKCYACRSLGRNPCLCLSPNAFLAVILISLFDQFPGFFRKLLNG